MSECIMESCQIGCMVEDNSPVFLSEVDTEKLNELAPRIKFFETCPWCSTDLAKVMLYAIPHSRNCKPNIEAGIKCSCWKFVFRHQLGLPT